MATVDLQDEKKQQLPSGGGITSHRDRLCRSKIFRDDPATAKVLSMYLSYKTQLREDDLMEAFELIKKYRNKPGFDNEIKTKDIGSAPGGSGLIGSLIGGASKAVENIKWYANLGGGGDGTATTTTTKNVSTGMNNNKNNGNVPVNAADVVHNIVENLPLVTKEVLAKELLNPGGDSKIVFNQFMKNAWIERKSDQDRWQNRANIRRQLSSRVARRQSQGVGVMARAVADANVTNSVTVNNVVNANRSNSGQSNIRNEVKDLRNMGFQGEIVTPDDRRRYKNSRDQYATSTHDGPKMHPRMIVYPKKDNDHNDIKIILKYAYNHKPEKLKVMARSGGHQYSGLSSGDKDTILVDIVDYDKKKIIEDKDGRLILTIEPNVSLGGMEPNEKTIGPDGEKQAAGLGQYLTSKGAALPYGMCSSVHIGGHVQTGGFGNILRGFGLTLDYCIGFKIVTYSGNGEAEVLNVTKPGINSDGDGDDGKYDVYNGGGGGNYGKNYDMYWAVMGGNPGSFGIVIEYTFDCIRNKDHKKSAGVRFMCLYNRKKLKEMMHLYRSLMESDVTDKNLDNKEIHPLPKDYDIVFTIVNARTGPQHPLANSFLELFPVIIFNGCFSNVDGENGPDYDPSYFEKFIQIAKKNYRWGPEGYIETFNGKKSISEMMEAFIVLPAGWHREYDLPFNKRVRASRRRWTHGMVNSYVDAIDDIFSLGHRLRGFRIASQLGLCGSSCYNKDPKNEKTSLARRDTTNMVIFDIFHPEGESYFKESEEMHKDLEKYWIGHDWSYLDKNDVRYTWATFGDSNIKTDWKYYYGDKDGNSRIYPTLQRIKQEFDPDNIFQNQFTIPLPTKQE